MKLQWIHAGKAGDFLTSDGSQFNFLLCFKKGREKVKIGTSFSRDSPAGLVADMLSEIADSIRAVDVK